MFYYWLHVLYVFLASRLFWKKIDADASISRTRRVSILDCEGLRFMANFKYLFYMDLIRYELLFRSKLYDATVKKGILPILGSQKIVYKKPLKRWSKFSVTLILEGWDEKWAYHRQIFQRNGQVVALGFTRVAFWKNKEVQSMRNILNDAGIEANEMEISAEVRKIFEDDHLLLKSGSHE